MADAQLEEYRRKMQEKHKSKEKDQQKEKKSKEAQEKAYNDARLQLEIDEELARKMENDENQPLIPDNNRTSSYPPPSNYPPNPPLNPQPYQSYNYQNPNRSNPSQPLVQRQDEGFFPVVTDKCCCINSQVLVLSLAFLLVLGIIAGVIFLAVN